jgi:hypothetical protein
MPAVEQFERGCDQGKWRDEVSKKFMTDQEIF